MSKGSSEANILTFLRIRPSKKPSGYFSIANVDTGDGTSTTVLNFNIPDNIKADYVNNSQLKFQYHFNGIIDMSATQDEVFDRVGTAAVQNAIDGFNSTIFAYGQTGSGKTFTLTGGPEKYSDRGLIPRSISLIFNSFRKKTDVQLKAYISYFEIYQGDGFDLLDPSHENKALEQLPKVRMLEDDNGNFHLKNLSMHVAVSEEEALNLLFLGDTNRAIAETPMNMASSRSHCIFTMTLELRMLGSDVIRRSKLHLVDLAGSERVAKTNSSGTVLAEAKYINTSLFFLERVIVALYEKATKGRSHIPYRDSLMTSVLRDSLGGNCKTIMIATINPEASHTDESLSTCRFAQRVSLIRNRAVVNEDVDPALVIAKLRAEILSLREEIAYLKNECGEGDALGPAEEEKLREAVLEYAADTERNRELAIGKLTLNKIKTVFSIFRDVCQACKGGSSSSRASINDNGDAAKQILDLKALLLQRDNEIAILVSMVKSGKTVGDVAAAERGRSSGGGRGIDEGGGDAKTVVEAGVQSRRREEKIIQRHLFGIAPPDDKSLFDDPAACFEWFKPRHELTASIEENKNSLRDRSIEAKKMGERAQQSKNTINYLKNSIESIRRDKAIEGMLSRDSSSDAKEDTEEETHRRAIEQEKIVYKESIDKLRALKPEIEHIKMLIEKGISTVQLQFDQWYNSLYSRRGVILTASSLPLQATPRRHSLDNACMSPMSGQTSLAADSKSRSMRSESTVSVTSSSKGDADDVNDDIIAFYQAKEELLRRRGK